MKKIYTFFVLSLFIISCSDSYDPVFELRILPIDQAQTPASFEYRTSDTIALKYTLPSSCYRFRSVYYEYERNTRVVAINALYDLESVCTQATIEEEIKIPIHVLQEENYIFKFYKGKDSNGDSIFEEVEVPVTN